MKALVVANWKMNPASWRDAKRLFEATRKSAERTKGVALVVAPPAIFLRDLTALYKGKKIVFAAQNAHFGDGGSFTGELSLAQLRDAKAQQVIIGHAERRALGETNDDVRKKVAAALARKMTPYLCVGETKRDASGEHFTRVREQLRAGLADVPSIRVSRVIIAYEPVWAIGAEQAMDARSMQEMAIFIRKMVVEQHGEPGMNIKILYGGSVDETNAADMLAQGGVNGLLVGRASTDPAKFAALLDAASGA